MGERVTSAERVRLQNRAEAEIHRYPNHMLWHKHVHNVELDTVQALKMEEMDRHPNTVDFSCRRTGKTAGKELYLLENNARHPDQELGIVAPREGQARNNLDYHLDAVRRSDILKSYIARRAGRAMMADTYYQFANRSRARSYGIYANVDGGDLTAASLEEVDDMPADRLFSRFLLMMGATRRLGADRESRNDPQIRITGVFKGADTLAGLVSGGLYHVLTTVNVYMGIRMGILNRLFMEDMREQLSPDEYVRQLLCLNRSARNLIFQRYVRQAMQVGLRTGLELAGPLPGMTYRKRGLISFGYDAGGHGEEPHASRHALVVAEQIGNFVTFPFVKTWPAHRDEPAVKDDLKAFWRYFRPDVAHGDAYGIGMLTQLCDELYAEGLTPENRRAVGDGESTASTWPDWPFVPIRFEGMVKHQMATALKTVFHTEHAALPYFEDLDLLDSATADLRLFTRQLVNVKPEPTTKPYPSYRMADRKLGDDLFDAAMASVWGLVIRGAAPVETQVLTRRRSREQLLGTGKGT